MPIQQQVLEQLSFGLALLAGVAKHSVRAVLHSRRLYTFLENVSYQRPGLYYGLRYYEMR